MRNKYKYFSLVVKSTLQLALIIGFIVSCTLKPKERTVDSNKIEFRNNLFYYQDERIPYTGRCVKFYQNGEKQKEQSVRDGKYEGPTVRFYENGQKSNEVNYIQGVTDGLSTSWYRNGQKKTECTYKGGAITGKYIKWDYKGNRVFEKKYLPGETTGPEKINISSERDVISKREMMIRHIWGEKGWPANRLVDSVETNIIFTTQDGKTPYQGLYNDLGNLKQIDCYKVFLPNSFVSKVYHFRPLKGNHKVFFYHSGHTPGGFHVEDVNANNGGVEPGLVIPKLLKEGYDVVAVMLPLSGNDLPEKEFSPGVGKLTDHDQMFDYLDHPYIYFLEDMVATINYLEKTYSFTDIYLMGLSGGGWATTIYAALDPRIRYSFPVAGSMPTYLRVRGDVGDAEQGTFEEYDPDGLYHIVNFEELYVLGSYGEGRRQIQILNEFDDCCFDGKRHPTWIDNVKEVVRKLGKGEYDFYLEQDTKTHKVSKQALDVILASIGNHTIELQNEPPVIAIDGKEYRFTPEIKTRQTCTPVSNLAHSLIIAPSWLSVNSQSGVITGKPTLANVGDTLYSYKVVDGYGGFIIKDVKVKVLKE